MTFLNREQRLTSRDAVIDMLYHENSNRSRLKKQFPPSFLLD